MLCRTVTIPEDKLYWHISRIYIKRVDSSVANSFMQFTIFAWAETPFNHLQRIFILISNAAAIFRIDGY